MSNPKVLLITPPFTQLNTPYPGTCYLKGYLNTQQVASYQVDLGIEVILRLFSKAGLRAMFDAVEAEGLLDRVSDNAMRIYQLREEYIATVHPVIRMLQHKNPTLAYSVAEREFLPEASRFDQLADLEWAFGNMGVQDKARHLATLYLEDLADFIKEAVDPHFGFSRYAERLGMSASSFDEMAEALSQEPSFIDGILMALLEEKIQHARPNMVCLSVPFPGNLYGALRCGQYIKANHPGVHVVMGGGYPNTELRSVSDPRVFAAIDFITLDDGERPIHHLMGHLFGDRKLEDLKRTFSLVEGKVVYHNGSKQGDVSFGQTGTPDYSDLPIDRYLSVLEVANPMHRLWSDGRWNKLTMAHGCYWKKCSFCDISLDYIKNYEPVSASILCDRMEEQMEQTGETGFHFVDEAAPPALMRELALEILRRKLVVTWWTNIRFESRFTPDLCRLLKISGCIAVSGGLEVASDRLLEKMKKGVTVEQVAQVAENFTQSGIMVHAYLMYGFPTQTDQETIDSLEMVRQLFMHGVIQSGFWHQFAMTAHAPAGLEPEFFGVERVGPVFEGFANNDLQHVDTSGADHVQYSEGLKKSLFNYMHGICFDYDLQEWFDFEVPGSSIPAHYIEQALADNPGTYISDSSRVVWLAAVPVLSFYEKRKKGKITVRARLSVELKSHSIDVTAEETEGKWLHAFLNRMSLASKEKITFAVLRQEYERDFGQSIDRLIHGQAWQELKNTALLIV
ncbi:radical SAM protein [Gilvimarinus agarilyticus]|uniref:B12-binding domain-containing radical SAM protein n=1 Tax=Reichenbachiella agariperforans TaxID=156994 RepID=UPI001C084166|nr:radical SAM protein [Reichenbachiella agariperforans]MBU2886064.1 radical SAM protein [Gilvimarinus agarilyticus]MBU2913532.1 radical SAM protein [Reichenbachiella agariperforans]